MNISRRIKSDQNNWALKKTLLWVILLLNQVIHIFVLLLKNFIFYLHLLLDFLIIIIDGFNLYFSSEDGHSNV